MNTNRDDVYLKDEVYRIVGCAMEVLNELGHGFHEKPYGDALIVELLNFRRAKLEWERVVL